MGGVVVEYVVDVAAVVVEYMVGVIGPREMHSTISLVDFFM